MLVNQELTLWYDVILDTCGWFWRWYLPKVDLRPQQKCWEPLLSWLHLACHMTESGSPWNGEEWPNVSSIKVVYLFSIPPETLGLYAHDFRCLISSVHIYGCSMEITGPSISAVWIQIMPRRCCFHWSLHKLSDSKRQDVWVSETELWGP